MLYSNTQQHFSDFRTYAPALTGVAQSVALHASSTICPACRCPCQAWFSIHVIQRTTSICCCLSLSATSYVTHVPSPFSRTQIKFLPAPGCQGSLANAVIDDRHTVNSIYWEWHQGKEGKGQRCMDVEGNTAAVHANSLMSELGSTAWAAHTETRPPPVPILPPAPQATKSSRSRRSCNG